VDGLGQFYSGHAGHVGVGDEKIEIFPIEGCERLGRAYGGDGTVAFHAEDVAGEAAEHLIVVDDQDFFHSAPPNSATDSSSGAVFALVKASDPSGLILISMQSPVAIWRVATAEDRA
jgi:hypothetical protein